jgi:type IV pilus assembly protein PilW
MNATFPATQPRQFGFSLIELMIAITLGMLIVAAVLALYLNITRSNSELAKVNSQIESGRFAIQLLENDVVHAGFWGTSVPQFDDLTQPSTPTTPPTPTPPAPADTPTAVPDPCLTYNATNWNTTYKNNLIGIPVQAYDSATVGTCTVVSSKAANTDVLLVRHAETCVPGVGNCEADIAGKLYFQSTLCSTDTTPYMLDTAGYTLHNRNCATVADKRKFISNIYYIRDYAVTAGDGIPTLMRSSFDSGAFQPAQPLIEGIDGFRVEFGIDNLSKTGAAVDYTAALNWQDPATKKIPTNRGDGIPDGAYVRCTTGTPCTVPQLTNATVVKIYVLARAREFTRGYTDAKTYTLGSTTLGPFNDNFKRHVFSTTVRLTNVSGRRETP